MITRLWWKEARLFWPIAAVLFLAAAVAQWLALRYDAPDARIGVLAPMALAWACLYALAVGAAAFAGEREGHTLLLLDTMPVGRRLLWGGKASFAVLSTMALAVVLFALAAVSTERWDAEKYAPGMVAAGFAVLLLQAIGWGLFWSSVRSSALAAAVLAVLCTGLIAFFSSIEAFGFSSPQSLEHTLPLGLALALATMIASYVVITAPERAARRSAQRWSRWHVRSPLVLHAVPPSEPEPEQPREVVESWRPAFRSLLWQAWRESHSRRWLLIALGWVPPLIVAVFIGSEAGGLAIFLSLVAGLIAGVSVFEAENRGRTHRFLANHAARPGLVWMAKMAVWSVTLAMVWLPLAVLAIPHVWGPSNSYFAQTVLVFLAALANSFAVGQLCGMTIRRGITAGVVAMVALFAVVAAQAALLAVQMLPTPWLLAPPLAFMAITWAWSGDWLLDRPGFGRWARLGALMFAVFGTIGAGYAATRAWSVSDPGPVPGTKRLAALAVSIMPESDAAPLYGEAERRLTLIHQVGASATAVHETINEGWNPEEKEVADWLESNQAVLATIREAAARPRCRLTPIDKMTLFNGQDVPWRGRLEELARLVAVSSRSRQFQGDLAGAWGDIVVMLRMARHVAAFAPLAQANLARRLEEEALGLAMRWSSDPRLTREQIRAALEEFRALPAMSPPSETVKVEALLAERTLDQPIETLREQLYTLENGPSKTIDAWKKFALDAMTTPWEIVRARRVFRTLFSEYATVADQEPAQRRRPVDTLEAWNQPILLEAALVGRGRARPTFSDFDGTPTVHLLFPNLSSLLVAAERNLVEERALVQILALRSWQLAHEGRFPEKLEDLVPDELAELPLDPYVNVPFRYTWSSGQSLLPLGQLHADTLNWKVIRPTRGTRLLYSVGPDRRDDGARADYGYENRSNDMIFPPPPSTDAPPANEPPSPEP